MKVLVFADFRSPHAVGWAAGLEAAGTSVRRVSSIGSVGGSANVGARSGIGQRLVQHVSPNAGHRIRTAEALARQPRRMSELRSAVDEFRPDLVHALRLPYEGVCALSALQNRVPVLVSTWGQDFTAQAAADPVLRRWIRRTLPSAAGLIADVDQDVDRARIHGLGDVPTLVAAANFGMSAAQPRQLDLAAPTITYTRGLTTHVNYEAFVAAMPKVLEAARTRIRFVGVGLANLASAREISTHPSFEGRVELTGKVDFTTFGRILRRSTATCSPATSDGMPISVLQSLAEGCRTLVAPLPQFDSMAKETDLLAVMDRADEAAIVETILALDEQWANGPARQMSTPFVPATYDRVRNFEVVPQFYAKVLHGQGR